MSSGGTNDTGSMLEDGLLATKQSGAAKDDAEIGLRDQDDLVTDGEWRIMFRDALDSAAEYQETKLRAKWNRNYRAVASEHMSGSKYQTGRYRNRSKLFKPKTRMALRKNDATAASAMFSTADVVSVTAEESSDRVQLLTAKFVNAALNYRLDRGTKMTGPRWFLTAIGARQDAQITGICVTKQFWEYEELEYDEEVTKPKIDAMGMPVTHPATGEAVMEQTIERSGRKVVRDRPMCLNIPPEQAFVDPSAYWCDPIQDGGFFIAGFPMRVNDAQGMIDAGAARSMVGGARWRSDINVKKVMSARSEQSRRNEATRRSREGGIDRYESRHAGKQNDIVWLYECFYRYDGEDWTFWMLGENIMLTDPVPTRDAYPEQDGDRPYTFGLGSLETHKVHPMSPVESWQPLQQEMNDITNLTLDAQKMSISPITKIRRGRSIDWKQVQNRGPDAAIMVEEPEDVTFEKAPGPSGGEQMQMNNLAVDFDELAGVFSTGSVQTNRQLNETVGGMQLMQGSSNALTEFDLRVWVETWAEPTLRQMVRLIQHYESSAHVIALAGKTAGLIVIPGSEPTEPGTLSPDQPGTPQPGEDEAEPEPPLPLAEVLANLDSTVISVKVNVGIGAVDNKQKAEKFVSAMKVTNEIAPLLALQGIVPKATEMMNEFYGLVGYKDADRFFMKKPKDDSGPPPEVQKVMLQMKLMEQKGQIDAMKAKMQMQMQQQTMQADMLRMRAELMMARQESEQAMELERQAAELDMQIEANKADQEMQIAERQAELDRDIAFEDARQSLIVDRAKGQQQLQHGDQAHQQKVTQAKETSQLQITHQAKAGEQKIQQTKQAADVKIDQTKKAGDVKVQTTRAMAAAKPAPGGKDAKPVPAPKADPMEGMMKMMSSMVAEMSKGNQALAKAIEAQTAASQAPREVTTPEGRKFKMTTAKQGKK